MEFVDRNRFWGWVQGKDLELDSGGNLIGNLKKYEAALMILEEGGVIGLKVGGTTVSTLWWDRANEGYMEKPLAGGKYAKKIRWNILR